MVSTTIHVHRPRPIRLFLCTTFHKCLLAKGTCCTDPSDLGCCSSRYSYSNYSDLLHPSSYPVSFAVVFAMHLSPAFLFEPFLCRKSGHHRRKCRVHFAITLFASFHLTQITLHCLRVTSNHLTISSHSSDGAPARLACPFSSSVALTLSRFFFDLIVIRSN